jgi:prephenate dehydrogenase
MKRIVLVGLGLIGGSIGLALRRSSPKLEIVGVDSVRVLDSERCKGLLTSGVASERSFEPSSVAQGADLVILAMPVREIARQLHRWLNTGIPVTDCGSTKAHLVETVARCPNRQWFLPGHPMAGRERGGLESASPDLFQGRPWLVCPQSTHLGAIEVTRSVVDQLGGIWTEMTATEHDQAVALTSHLPQVVASWLLANGGASTPKAAGPAFSDMTRVAGGSEAIWSDIFVTNAVPLATALEHAAADFESMARDLRQSPPNADSVLALLAKARTLREVK